MPRRPRFPAIARVLPVIRAALGYGALWGGMAGGMLRAGPAAAWITPCAAQITGLSQIAAAGGYDPFGSLPPPVYNTLTVRLLAGSNCSYAVGIDNGMAGYTRRMFGWNGYWMSYDLYRDGALSQRITDINTGNTQGLITGTLGGGSRSQQTLSFYSSIPAGQLVPPGYYWDQVTLSLYHLDSYGNVVGILDSQTVLVRAGVRGSIQASIIAGGVQTPLAGALATVNFGTLYAGATGSFEVDVSGNSGYTLTIQSQNGGQMLNTATPGGGGGGGIRYSLSMDGRTLNPAGGNTLSYNTLSTLDRHQFLVTIGDVTHVLAGNYSDSLLVTVTAN